MLGNNGTQNSSHASPSFPEDTPYKRRGFPWIKVAILCILIGAGLFAAGWASGSRGGRIYFDRGIRVVSAAAQDMSGSTDISFDRNIHTITANSTSCDIRIVPGDVPRVVSNNIRANVRESGGRLYIDARQGNTLNAAGVSINRRNINLIGIGTHGVTWSRTDGRAHLDFDFDFTNFSFRNMSNAITIYVPDTVNNINAASTSGSVHMDGISTTELYLRSTSGGVTVEGGTHENTRLRSTSGRVRASAYIAGDLYARSTSGGVAVQDYSTSHRNVGGNGIQLRSTSGSVNFSTRAPISDFNYSLSVTSGGMRVDGNSISGRNASGGNGPVRINASSTSGGVRLNFSE